MKKWVKLLVAVGILTAIGINVMLFLVDGAPLGDGSYPTAKPKLVIDSNAGPSPTPSPTAPGIAIPGWAGLSLPAGVSEADVPLYNPEANADWYYLTFELRLKETDEDIFSTGLIPPGMYCNKVTLSRPLQAGTYECTMVVQPYFIREVPTPTNNAVFDIKLSVY